jgi:pimeloyl-ACP methyl ester carboxylesterase
MRFSQRLALSYIRTKFKLLAAISKKKAAEKAFDLFCTPQRRNRKAMPKIFGEAETLHFKLDGTNLTGWQWNKGGGKKLLILHGFESSVINFDRYVRPFIKKGYEVLAFDAPAHGRSGGKTINAPLYKKMIMEINKRYGPIDYFISHSFGGLALSLALEDISHSKDNKVVLIAPATETETAIDFFFKFLRLDPDIRPEFEKAIIKRGGVTPAWYSVRRALKNIRASVLWVHDEGDEVTPIADVKKAMDDRFSNIEFYITNGLGHRRIYRDNNVTKKIIEFL